MRDPHCFNVYGDADGTRYRALLVDWLDGHFSVEEVQVGEAPARKFLRDAPCVGRDAALARAAVLARGLAA